MLREISWRQFLDWWAFDEIEPFDDHRSDWQAASICAAVMNASERIMATLANRRQVRKVWQPKDLVLEYGKDNKVAPLKEGGSNWQRLKMAAELWHHVIREADKRG